MTTKPLTLLFAALLALGCSNGAAGAGSDGGESMGGSAGGGHPQGGGGTFAGGAGTTGAGATGAGATGAGGSGGSSASGGNAGSAGNAGTSGGSDGTAGMDTSGAGGGPLLGDGLVYPKDLSVLPHAGGCGVLKMVALTLRAGDDGSEVYAALKNDSSTPACSPAFSLELFDKDEQSLVSTGGGLLVKHFYQVNDDAGNMAACAGPGDVAMIAVTGLPPLASGQVAHLDFWCNFWMLDVTPIGELGATNVEAMKQGSTLGYTGTLTNGLDVPVSTPSVNVFPLNAAGRPLGMVSAHGSQAVPAGGSWDFETDQLDAGVLDEAAVDQAVYPASGP